MPNSDDAARHALLWQSFQQVQFGIVVYDAQFKLALANDAYRHLLDLPAAAVQPGFALTALFDLLVQRGEYLGTAGEERARQRLRAVFDGEAVAVERPRPNGRWIEARYIPLNGGGSLQIYNDVTNRIEARWRSESAVLDLQTRIRELEGQLAERGGKA